MWFKEFFAVQLLLNKVAGSPSNYSNTLPVVDLGYELYRASAFNQTDSYFTFSNIRYAAPPVGELRFRAPAAPAVNRTAIQDSSRTSPICLQAYSAWNFMSPEWLPGYLANGTVPQINFTDFSPYTSIIPKLRQPQETEDCLFLDVFVTEKAFEKRYSAKQGGGAAVLVWIHGGGYSTGSKVFFGHPSNMLSLSGQNGASQGIVFVSINYRLGAPGWMSGTDFENAGGLPNAGLYDQRMALEWVQENIHHFGGDKNRVTVIGESGGSGSITHHIAAYGAAPVPFRQAILQSPAWFPNLPRSAQDSSFQQFLHLANASSLEHARNLSTDALMTANTQIYIDTTYGRFPFGPVVDFKMIHEDANTALASGRFNKSLKLMVARNDDEGLVLTPPLHDAASFLPHYFSTLNDSALSFLTDTLYPPIYNGSQPYHDLISRTALIIGDAVINCNAHALSAAFANSSYAYIFAVSPGLHGQDIGYTFYRPGVSQSVGTPVDVGPVDGGLANILQNWIVSFVSSGKPRSVVEGLAEFSVYGKEGNLLKMTGYGISEAKAPSMTERCSWWRETISG